MSLNTTIVPHGLREQLKHAADIACDTHETTHRGMENGERPLIGALPREGTRFLEQAVRFYRGQSRAVAESENLAAGRDLEGERLVARRRLRGELPDLLPVSQRLKRPVGADPFGCAAVPASR